MIGNSLTERQRQDIQAWLAWKTRLQQGDEKARRTEIELCKRNRWRYMTSWVYTKDTDDIENPFKLFPPKPYIYHLDKFLDEMIQVGRQHFGLYKTRRMIMTNYFSCGRFQHRAQFWNDQELYVQSRKENAALRILMRIEASSERMPAWFRGRKTRLTKKPPTLVFPSTGSVIFGVPQGRESIRGEGAVEVLSDEWAFQPEARTSWAGIKPALGRSGVFFGLTTPNWHEFSWEVYTDQTEL